jgi:hypothetical protein
MKIGNSEIRSTGEIISPALRLCAMMWSQPKFGKTKWAAGLDKVTKRWYNKPTLIIAVEAADGGGTATIAQENVDYVEPRSLSDFQGIVSALQTDTTYGGIVLDNASDLVKRYIQPEALKLPYEKGSAPASRMKGVPAQGDYQTMGEMLRTELNKLVNLTKRDTPESIRKHLIVTALQYEKTNREGTSTISIGPALPGQMADTASAMFQTMLTLEIETKVVPNPANPKETIRIYPRVVVSEADGKKILGDRFKIFPPRGPFSLEEVWEKYWIPATEKKEEVKVGS